MGTLQQLDTYYSDVMRIAVSAIPSADATTLTGLAAQVDAGTLPFATAATQVEALAVSTTSVANMAYQFFTGLTPYEVGVDYLVSPTGGNSNSLNSPYYQGFSVVNRFIDFAVNLGVLGQGQQQFAAAYASLSMSDAVTAAYTTIFGTAPAAALVSSILNDAVANGLGGTETRQQYFAYYGGDGPTGIGTKAAMVGWLLSVAATGNTGVYAQAEDAFLADLAPDGLAHFYTNLVTTYGPQSAGSPGATISFNHDQSVSPTAANPALQSTSGNDTVTGAGGLDVGQSVITGNGNDTLTIPGVVYGTIQMGNGNNTLTIGGLGDPPPAAAQTASVTLGGGNNTVYLNGATGTGTSITATGSDNTLYVDGPNARYAGTVSGFQTIVLSALSDPDWSILTHPGLTGAQTIVDEIPFTGGTTTISIQTPHHETVVLRNTSYGVTIADPTAAGQSAIEVHLDNFSGAPTTSVNFSSPVGTYNSVYSANGGAITAFATFGTSNTSLNASLVLHVDSNSTAGMIAGYYTAGGPVIIFDEPIPNLVIEGVGALTAQIYSSFTNIDASAAGDLNLTYVPGFIYGTATRSFLFSNGTDSLNLNLSNSGVGGSEIAPVDYVMGTGTDTITIAAGTKGLNNLFLNGQTLVITAEIDGFHKGVDHLVLDAVTQAVTPNVQQYADGAASLAQALANVSAHTAINTAAIFTYAGDTYVYQQDTKVGVNALDTLTGVDTVDAGDGLIKLAGVTGLSVVTGSAVGDIHYG